jgi:adenylate cyclase
MEITAFFSDVASFSTISEKLTSVELAALLNEYLSAMTLILKKHGGTLDKYIGDAVVGIFGAPVPAADTELAAARASLEMLDELETLRTRWKAADAYCPEAHDMRFRIGLNSGPAKVGFMGTDTLASYTMMGDTVNLAARLEAAGKDYGVAALVSEAIEEKVRGEILLRKLDMVRVKGKHHPVTLYELVGYPGKVAENRLKANELYEKAFARYLERDFDGAITLLGKAAKARKETDRSIDLLKARCILYKQTAPPPSWDGVFTRTSK